MRRIATIAAIVLGLALVACGGDDDSAETGTGDVPTELVEAVRAEYPRTHTDLIGNVYREIRAQDPDASDADLERWVIEVVTQNEATEAWNDCLEETPTGERCGDPEQVAPLSEDNPYGF